MNLVRFQWHMEILMPLLGSEAVSEKGRVLKNHLSLHYLCKSLPKTSFLLKVLSGCRPDSATLLFNNTSSNLPDLIACLTSGGRFLAPGPALIFMLYTQAHCRSSANSNTPPLRARFVTSLVDLYTEEEYGLWESLRLCLDR